MRASDILYILFLSKSNLYRMQDWSQCAPKATKLVQLRGRVPEVTVVILMLLTLGFLPWLAARRDSSRKPGLVQVCAIIMAASVVSVIGWYVLNRMWQPTPSYIGIEVFGPLVSGLSDIVALIVVAFSKKPGCIIMGFLICSLSVLGAYAVPSIYCGTYANLAQMLRGPGKVQTFGEVDKLAPIADVYRPGDSESAKQTSLEQR